VNDIDDELRELLQRRADNVPPHHSVPAALLSRARRRIALNALGAGVVVVALAAGAFTGVKALTGLPSPRRPGGSSPSPTLPAPSTIVACTPAQLRAVGSMSGAAGSREGEIAVTNLSDRACTLQGTPAITLLDQNQVPITSGIAFSPAPAGWVVDRSPKPAGWPVVTLRQRHSASVRIRWSNWCAAGGVAPLWRIEIPGGGAVDVNGLDAVGPPPCNGPDQPSTIEEGPFEPPAGP
jgi:uncharacterized protein DUF4232